MRFILKDQDTRRNLADLPYIVGEWFHVGYIFKDGETSVYKDGCLVTTGQWKWGEGWTVGNYLHDFIQFGHFPNSTEIRINMQMDEVYIWQRGISPLLLRMRFSAPFKPEI